jgi:hypothetical protein
MCQHFCAAVRGSSAEVQWPALSHGALWPSLLRDAPIKENLSTVMHRLHAIAAIFALLLPLAAQAGVPAPQERAADDPASALQGAATAGEGQPRAHPLAALYRQQSAQQVRIEQRVMVRIAPAAPLSRQSFMAELPPRAPAPRFEETRKQKCVPLEEIAGVQTGSGNRLVLFLRDRQMISVNLDKSCRARDFYAGFYVEKNKDGRLCVNRDELQSRTGVRCEVESMRQLAAVRD